MISNYESESLQPLTQCTQSMRLLYSLVELKVNVEGTQERKNKISLPDFVYVLLGDISFPFSRQY